MHAVHTHHYARLNKSVHIKQMYLFQLDVLTKSEQTSVSKTFLFSPKASIENIETVMR